MAALNHRPRTIVRAARPGEGAAIAGLWRELWDAHEHWGGYPGSRDPRVYAHLAARLEEDARMRAGHPTLGRHVHLVAEHDGELCGQVEGWLDHHGSEPLTPQSCDVRSLIVRETARRAGAGRELLSALAVAARRRDGESVLAAEVLEPNPAHAFYARVGYMPVAYAARIAVTAGARAGGETRAGTLTARRAVPADALALACLESTLAARRRAAGDTRFDRPRAIDATLLAAIAAHLADSAARDPSTLVVADASGVVRGSASFAVHALEPPFLPARRALLGRVALDPASAALPLFAPLAALACQLAATDGASHMEITDLSAPGTDLYRAVLAVGASPWSRVVMRRA
jgi:GNAT superfamily N-acetyltransferase